MDGTNNGRLGRDVAFSNRSTNCKAVVVIVDGKVHVGLFATKPIGAGDELLVAKQEVNIRMYEVLLHR